MSKLGEPSREDVVGYELSPFPTALFEARNVFGEHNPQLAHAVTDHMNEASNEHGEVRTESVTRTEHYVFDVHRLLWKKGEPYGAIAESHAYFTIMHYCLATIVFDDRPSIKDNTHQKHDGQKVIHPL